MNERSWVEINLSNYAHNIRQLKRKFAPADFMQIVKADAYGHGAFEIARKAVELGAKYLGTANLAEAKLLRLQGIDLPILILSPSFDSEIDEIVKYKITPSVSDENFYQQLSAKAKSLNSKIKIHINIDTGMGRSGFNYCHSLAIIKKIIADENIEVEGIFTHFSASESDDKYSLLQYERFQKFLNKLDFQPKFIHLANSVAAVKYDFPEANLVRLGLLTFGINSDLKNEISLKQVMSFYANISQIKEVEAGESIGYNRTFVASQKMKYAVLPIGYADGYDFLLSNKGKVWLKNQFCQIIGKVSMDMICIDITDVANVQVGQQVTLLSDNPADLQADKITQLYDGLSYELLCQLGRRAKRYYLDNDEITDFSPISRRAPIITDFGNKKLNELIETALKQRLNSADFSSIVYQELLQDLFSDSDKRIYYRENFYHYIEFEESKSHPDYFKVETILTFDKRLQNNYFYIVCAKNERDLEKYLTDRTVEYRWLLDEQFKLEESFVVKEVSVDGISLQINSSIDSGCLKIKCEHPRLAELVNQKSHFKISTQTFYPKSSHQLSVFISEITKNIEIEFRYPQMISPEIIPVFSGRKKFPSIIQKQNSIKILSKNEDWIFPTSGVVFAY